MNFRRHLREPASPLLQVTFLLNVVLLLLGLVLGGLLLPRWTGANLSGLSHTSADVRQRAGMVIAVAATGEISINRQIMTLDELHTRLTQCSRATKPPTVLLRADARAPLAPVLDVSEVCRNHGLLLQLQCGSVDHEER